MPGAHRDEDLRYCGGQTKVEGQTNVYVNNKLWAVDGDPEQPGSHGGGPLKPIYGAKNVYINSKLVICAAGDTSYTPDDQGHPPGRAGDDPYGHSTDVAVYGGGAGG